MANATKTFVQFGAGNIGRSFIGRLFAEAGYRVVFIDVDSRLVSLLNERRSYPVVVKQNDRPDQVRLIGGVSAIDGRDREAVIDVLTQADGMATSVGQRGLRPFCRCSPRRWSCARRTMRHRWISSSPRICVPGPRGSARILVRCCPRASTSTVAWVSSRPASARWFRSCRRTR